MAVPYETIKESFETIRNFILNDLNRIVSQPTGGNYAAVLLIMTACETLGRLRYASASGGGFFFGEFLLPKHWQPVSGDLYNALRNGLAHGYATKNILQVGDKAIELVISWKDKRHLSYETANNQLFINVQSLSAALIEAFDQYESDLKTSAEYRDRYLVWIKKDTEVQIQQVGRQKTWMKLLSC